MPWQLVNDYSAGGWKIAGDAQSRRYCAELERGEILFFPSLPFDLSLEDIQFLVSLKPADSRLHKNISYRPGEDLLRGFSDSANQSRVHEIMRRYADAVKRFVSTYLSPYARNFRMDYASFRPLEEEGRDLPLHKKNDLLHVDAFPSRPTRGGRILRVFTNVHPSKARVWVVGPRFPELASRFAQTAGVRKFATSPNPFGGLKRAFSSLGFPITVRSPYDRFMLHFHDWLKENTAFQNATEMHERLEFPPMATWLVFTDGVPHAALSGQFAMEQTFIIPVDALVSPEVSPIRVLEKVAGRAMN